MKTLSDTLNLKITAVDIAVKQYILPVRESPKKNRVLLNRSIPRKGRSKILKKTRIITVPIFSGVPVKRMQIENRGGDKIGFSNCNAHSLQFGFPLDEIQEKHHSIFVARG